MDIDVRDWAIKGVAGTLFIAPWFLFSKRIAVFVDGCLIFFGFAVSDIIDTVKDISGAIDERTWIDEV